MNKLDDRHWIVESYRQTMGKKGAQEVLRDRFCFVKGYRREFTVKHLGLGVYEVYKKPLL